MNKVAIVTDSTADIPKDLVERHGIKVGVLSASMYEMNFKVC